MGAPSALADEERLASLIADRIEPGPVPDVDLDGARLVVSQQVLSVEYKATVADVKKAHSRRTIDLDQRTVAVLRAWCRHQLEQKMSTGRRNDDEFVFTHPDGGPIHPDFFPSHGNG